MDLYTLKVNGFEIRNTRSTFSDTLHLRYSAYVDGDIVATKELHLGDLGGPTTPDHWADDELSPPELRGGLARVVINDPMAKVAFNFQLVNAGNVPAGALTGRLSSSADQLAGIAAGLSSIGATSILGAAGSEELFALGSTAFWIGIVLEAFANFYAWAEADCDGPVAVDQVAGPRYVLDAMLDTDTDYSPLVGGQVIVRTRSGAGQILIEGKPYYGIGAPSGCHDDSLYWVSWSFSRSREWVQVVDESPPRYPWGTGPVPLAATTGGGPGAVAHNGAIYAFVLDFPGLTAARSFTGASWKVIPIGPVTTGGPSPLPPSGASFNDRLYVLGVSTDGNIRTFSYMSDAGSWTGFETLLSTDPPNSGGGQGVRTNIGIATTVFRDRLHVIARDSATTYLSITSTDDLVTWDPWTSIPVDQGVPEGWTAGSVAAAALGDELHVFAVYRFPPPPPPAGGETLRAPLPSPVLLHNSMRKDRTWTGWRRVERGAKLGGGLIVDGGEPLDVAAVAYQNRIYIASRWTPVRIQLAEEEIIAVNVIAVNFTEDGDNWSGWRIPPNDRPDGIVEQYAGRAAGTTVALAGLGNHLYIFARDQSTSVVRVY